MVHRNIMLSNSDNKYKECVPVIPFRKKFEKIDVEIYLLSKCLPLMKIEYKFSGSRARVNPLTMEGVLLDYIGYSLYANILSLNKDITLLSVQSSKSAELSKKMRLLVKLRGIFCGSYGDAYRILID